MEFEYLTVEDVVDLHDMALRDYGGFPGRDPGNLEAKLAIPMSGFGSYERYPTIEEKAAVYHYMLADGHTFKDGNKRTSYLAVATFLDWNGYELVATDDEIYEWTLILANDKTRPPFEEAVHWIRTHMERQE
ncbi:type II toxin-antitoxin system death-on-curing family toxin [Fictibacillus fluitans]|uniref:Type II toxin-antitoxin system death-on-curing family toxin n=1 Tax=Fictibacillus fluitans TaxID=3058422 RepID=A0ABT8HUF8_9BACL|nr:type II toxin-antitoxin system death-on-curing family toxin [Fictibacillus sp. NE201]MDN4524403.1 type II toxin-antitoxin system death-on-curing family toxin [Fictibacillus sp. NE201]